MKVADVDTNPSAPHPREMIDLEAQFEQLESEMKDSNGSYEALQRSFLELTELKHILQKTQQFFSEEGDRQAETGGDKGVGNLGKGTFTKISLFFRWFFSQVVVTLLVELLRYSVTL